MSTRAIKLIIFFSAAALIGLVATQTYWIRNAMRTSQEHYEHRAQQALWQTIDEIKRCADTCAVKCNSKSDNENILHIVKPKMLDSLFLKYMNFNKLDTNFEFAIIKSKNDSIVFKTSNFTNKCSSDKIYKHCLSCIYNNAHYHIELTFPQLNKFFMGQVWNWLLLSGFFLIIIIFCFGFIVFAVFRQKRVSDMKTDFINNMTHEFKTPLSTISLASEILINTNAETNLEKIHRYARIINEENHRMQSQVDQVLRMAQLDKGEYVINKEETDIHELIQGAVHNLCLEHSEKPVEVEYFLNAGIHIAMVDPIHLTNLVKNLVENAYKYSPDGPKITISTSNTGKGITISVKDNGIGISADKLTLIFDKFYRVPTGNVHNVKGSGIGLYYVKVIAEAHSGKVSAKSEPGKGSRFDVFIPIN